MKTMTVAISANPETRCRQTSNSEAVVQMSNTYHKYTKPEKTYGL